MYRESCWLQVCAACVSVFSVSEYRRKRVEQYDSHDFFRADNAAAMEIRKKCSNEALEDACDWLIGGGEVAVSAHCHSCQLKINLISFN